MTKRIAIASQKGGCGKTTLALNLALAFAERGTRTLLADLDPQGGIGHSLRKGETELAGLADLLTGSASPDEAVLQTRQPALALLPRGRLDPIDACVFEQALVQNGALSKILPRVETEFDLVLLDTPAGVGMPTRAALAVADFVVIPLQSEPLSLRSIGQILRVVEHVAQNENERLRVLGIIPTMVDRENDASFSVLVESWRELALVLEAVIPRSPVFAQASETGLPLAYLAGKPLPEARRFELLAAELEALMTTATGEEDSDAARPQRQLL